ncbi:helix-turn-helix domain-containing protein [Yeosuana marina]|uniref:helix-turn-helix domain-containing protein n=1 Tax=Yeosuana marina TaxID=1565536 RepID=UPI0014221D54|nr:AraC family transcriptional regulator [Yeosuana marina]
MSLFIFAQLVFVIEYVLYDTNIQLRFPHTYLISSSLSLAIGPLLFFYFKRITNKYVFKRKDLLHFLPTILLLFFVLRPIYVLDASQKIRLMLGLGTQNMHYGLIIVLLKFISLIIYGIFIAKQNSINKDKTLKHDALKTELIWNANIYKIYLVYTVSYIFYCLAISGVFVIDFVDFVCNIHILSIVAMIGYVSFMLIMHPKLFTFKIIDPTKSAIVKYSNSGLSDTAIKELTEKLIYLLNEEKIFKDSSISLESLAAQLGTTRNNTSQIINEYFNLNFFELINKHRIEEAINIFQSDKFRNLNIIDVAFEVGYNNKVTFNKAFKKYTGQTPSKYLTEYLEVKL